jgi:hypothetical protein
MTRIELLKIVIGRARANGFEFRRWYTTRLCLPWTSAAAAIAALEEHRQYYALLFTHEFAKCFWKPGAEITFQVPARTFERRMPDGTIQSITRKPFIRRSARKDAWRYHLREMSVAEEPLRYIRRYLNVEGDLTDIAAITENGSRKSSTTKPRKPKSVGHAANASHKSPRPLPKEPPAFLQRPYP